MGHNHPVREQDSRVPPEVDQYLIELYARAGQIGGGSGGARGGARGAGLLKTVVEDRTGATAKPYSQLLAEVTAVWPRAKQLPAVGPALRIAIPLGVTGLAHIVVDIKPSDSASTTAAPVLVRAYGKEGLLNRKPTARIADHVAQVITG
jgi:hypothetical protein